MLAQRVIPNKRKKKNAIRAKKIYGSWHLQIGVVFFVFWKIQFQRFCVVNGDMMIFSVLVRNYSKSRFVLRPMLKVNAMLTLKLWIPQIPAVMFQYRSVWARIFTKKSQTLKKKTKKHSRAGVGPRSAWEQLSEMFNSKRRDSESRRSPKPRTA